ncbi:MAG: hypothetical protein FWH23_00870 [Bacteroidales bacterium]|nr:hypothetical protein [Bacteroidales bacterium]
MYIVVDFDGTCVTHEYPVVGREIGAAEVLRALVGAGHRLILFTMRSDNPKNGQLYLTDAVNWFREHSIPLYGIQTNPTQRQWTTSPKAYGELYIDDAALGCPLVYPEDGSRPHVDWKEVKSLLGDLLIA